MSPAGPHFIVIDYIDENGEIHIFDSGFKGLKFSDTYSPGNVLDVVYLNLNQVKKQKIYRKFKLINTVSSYMLKLKIPLDRH